MGCPVSGLIGLQAETAHFDQRRSESGDEAVEQFGQDLVVSCYHDAPVERRVGIDVAPSFEQIASAPPLMFASVRPDRCVWSRCSGRGIWLKA